MGHIFCRESYRCTLLVSVVSVPVCLSFLSWFGPLLCKFFHLFQEGIHNFPSFHFPLGMLPSDMSMTSLCFNGISSLVHFWRTVWQVRHNSANIQVTNETKNDFEVAAATKSAQIERLLLSLVVHQVDFPNLFQPLTRLG